MRRRIAVKQYDYYIGIDLGKETSYFVIKDRDGNLKSRSKVSNDRMALTQFLSPYQAKPMKAVIEATCNYYWMYQELSRLKIEVILAHPLKTRAIADAKVKNDRLDANVLSDLLRAGLIPQSYVPSEKILFLRELVRQHIRLVQMKTQVKNQVHSLLTKLNYRTESSDLFGKKGIAWLLGLPLPEVFRLECKQAVLQLESLGLLIKETDSKIRERLKEFPEARRLQDIPGIGLLSSAILTAEIGPIQRFPHPKKLVSYAGIAPGLYESGKTSHRRGITHEGSRYLRWILCEIAQVHVRKPGALRQFFLRLRQRVGYGKALTATARKLLIAIYFVLNGKPFAPAYAG